MGEGKILFPPVDDRVLLVVEEAAEQASATVLAPVPDFAEMFRQIGGYIGYTTCSPPKIQAGLSNKRSCQAGHLRRSHGLFQLVDPLTA